MELTQAQQDLVEKNIKLVYLVANKLNVQKNKDALQEGILGLCVASSKYNEDLSKFSTFAVKYIRGYILTFLNYDRLVKPHRRYGKYVYSDVCLIDDESTIKSNNNDGIVDLGCDVTKVLLKLDDTSKIIFQMLLEGFNQNQIADKLDCTQVSVSRKVKHIRNLIKENIYNVGE